MIIKPKFKDFLTIKTVEPNNVFLLSETGSYTLTGNIYYELSNIIDGNHSVDDITKQLYQKKFSLSEIYYGLFFLEQKGYITEANFITLCNKSAFWNYLDVDPIVAEHKLKTLSVSVHSCGNVDSTILFSALKSLDITISHRGDICLVLTDDYLRKDLMNLNNYFLKENIPWMLIKPVGIVSWIGPIFIPQLTGCWSCLSQRLSLHRQSELFIQKRTGIESPLKISKAALPSTIQIALNMAVTEIVKWIVKGENLRLQGNIITNNIISLETKTHQLIKRPQCKCCGTFRKNFAEKAQPISLQSRKKYFIKDGGHRVASPEITFKQYQHHISPITGIVNKLKKSLDTNNEYAHAYCGGQNIALSHESVNSLRQSLRSLSGGKGMSDVQAKVSCLCESLERYSGIFQGDEIRIKSSYKKLGSQAIHPNACMNFSAAQYQKRQQWNQSQNNSFHWIPKIFDEDLVIEWTPVWSLTNKVFKYLPTGYCYYNYPCEKQEREFYNSCSNGNAAGNSIEEAILQGFMELVERDSVSLWWYNRLKMPNVDLDSFDEPYINNMQKYYQSIHRVFWVLDLTNDFEIPVFVAISKRIDKPVEDIILGFGCHFDAKVAILRAITELNQFLPAVLPIDSKGKGKYLIDDKATISWWKTATTANQIYLVPDNNIPSKLYSDYLHPKNDDLLDDVLACVDIAQQNGMEMLVLDQTRPDVGLNVAKVIVPGMRHFWARFAPGRLYDVPVKLGWLKKPLQEDRLNPIPIFA